MNLRVLLIFLMIVVWVGALPNVTMQRAVAQGSFTKITSYRVNGAPDYDSPGNESFWRSVDWTSAPLAASVSPGGGHTQNVLVKSANDGFNVYVLFRWEDKVGPSFGSDSELYAAPNGTLLPLSDESTATVNQLFYNSTYYYQDRVAMLWYLGDTSQKQQSPLMELGSNGAITGGAADIWHWQSVPTDNDLRDADFPGGYTDPAGTTLCPPDNVSYAENDYTNMTGFFVTGGSFGADSPNLDPYADPFVVHVGNYFSETNQTWTVEMVRSLTLSDASQYRVQLKTGSDYYVAFAVWNGKLGESAHVKSVSQWYDLTISDQAPPTTPISIAQSTSSGISATLAGVVGFGLLIIGLVIGTIITRPKPKG
jgi:DMSO reductase family type II enzyme heme b subunit